MIGWHSLVSFHSDSLLSHAEQYTGRRILNLQTTLALVHSSVPPSLATASQETNPALHGLANLSGVQLGEILTKKRLAKLATQIGMQEIMRWKPKNVRYLSGIFMMCD